MIEPTDIKYAQRLRGLRLGKDIKQEEAAKLLGFNSQQQYSNLENGKMSFTDDIIRRICIEFEISPDDFVNTTSHIHFSNSPNANSNNSTNHNNDNAFVQELLRAKDELIDSLRAQIDMLKQKLQ